jgi:hypothetical protein
MSKRSANCDHSQLDILPGGVIHCRLCGEVIEDEGLEDSEPGDTGEMATEPESIVIYPLTFRLGDAHLK